MFRGKRSSRRRARLPAMLDAAALVAARPELDARVAEAEPNSSELAELLSVRSLACLADKDPEAALVDADAALGIGRMEPFVERQTLRALGQAVIDLGLASRYDEVLRRIEHQDATTLEPTEAQNLRVRRAQLLTLLDRGEEVAAAMAGVPLVVHRGRPGYGASLLFRAALALDAGDAGAALADVDTALETDLEPGLIQDAANLGAYCIAVLGREDRAAQALAWANLVCSSGTTASAPSLAHRETRAAALTVAGRGAEAISTLDEGLAFLERDQPASRARAWSHAFLARAHLDAGSLELARHHARLADEIAALDGTAVPVLDAVRDRLARPVG